MSSVVFIVGGKTYNAMQYMETAWYVIFVTCIFLDKQVASVP